MSNSAWKSAREAAAYAGRTSKWAYQTFLRLAREGKIRAGYDGKTYRFKDEDIDAWLYLRGKEQSNG